MKERFLNVKISGLNMHKVFYWPNNTRDLRIVWNDFIYKRMEEEVLKSIKEDLERYEILIGIERENVFPCERLIPFQTLENEGIIKERGRSVLGQFTNLYFPILLRYLINEMKEREKAIISHSHPQNSSPSKEDDCKKSSIRMYVGLTFKFDKFHEKVFAVGYKGEQLIKVYHNDQKISPFVS